MNKIAFWQNWTKSDRILFFVMGIIALFSIILTCFYWYNGLENIIRWDVISELEEIPVEIDKFSQGNLDFTVNANSYIINERYSASPINVNPTTANIYFGLVIIGILILVSVFSELKKWWILIGLAGLAAIFSVSGLENIFRQTTKTPFLITFGTLGGLMVVFNSFFQRIGFNKRLITFSILVAILLLITSNFSKVAHPTFAFVSYGYIVLVAISLIFIFFISHETFAGLVWIVSNSAKKDKSSTSQFFIISSIYLLNVVLIYLEKARFIDWSLFTISPFLLYFSSLCLGLWGFRQYFDQTPFLGVNSQKSTWLYIGMAIISTATIGYAFATANDPIIEVFEDFIAISHLCVGITFMAYVVINFIQPLRQGLAIHKVLYKPAFFPISLFKIAAVVGIFALISIKNYYSYFQTLSGYHNGIADYYVAENDLTAAEAFYKEGLSYDIRNHRSNYSLASLAFKVGNKVDAGYFLKNALSKNPSPQAYVALAKVLQDEDMFFDAFFQMQAGTKKFGRNPKILTNMAYFQSKVKQADSTKYYLDLAKQFCSDCDVQESNLMAFNVKYLKKDSLRVFMNNNTPSEYPSLRANRIAAENIFKNPFTTKPIEFSQDSSLNVSQFAVIYNSTLNKNSDTKAFDAKLIQKLQFKSNNQPFYEDLEFAKACQNYFKEDKQLGIKQLAILANDSTQHQIMYRRVAGMWFLQNDVYDKAIEYLKKANDKDALVALETVNYESQISQILVQKSADALGNIKTDADLEKAYKANPLNPIIISKLVESYNSKKRTNDAYKLVFKALELNDKSATLWKLYVLQSLKIGVSDYATDGLAKLQAILSPTDYQAFLSIYQAQKALMEKNTSGFN